MNSHNTIIHPITINSPMVLIPVEEYKELLSEAGYKPAPKLALEIKEARQRFKKRKVVPWEALKRELR